MRRTSTILAWGAGALLVAALPTAPAFAADATGCSGSAQSLTADGTALDEVSAPGDGGTESNPFVVDPQGTVTYEGSIDEAITSGEWSITVMGLPFLSGPIDNPAGDTISAGEVDVSSAPAPVQWVLATSAKVPVSGEMSGEGGSCVGSGFVAGTGDSTTSSPIFYAGAGFTLIGLAMFAGVFMGTKATVITTATTEGGGTA